MLTFILGLILSVPLYILFYLQYQYPEDAMKWGNRWMYKGDPEFSEEAIKYTKVTALLGIGVLSLIFVVWFFKVL